jgi:hypothetical protein
MPTSTNSDFIEVINSLDLQKNTFQIISDKFVQRISENGKQFNYIGISKLLGYPELKDTKDTEDSSLTKIKSLINQVLDLYNTIFNDSKNIDSLLFLISRDSKQSFKLSSLELNLRKSTEQIKKCEEIYDALRVKNNNLDQLSINNLIKDLDYALNMLFETLQSASIDLSRINKTLKNENYLNQEYITRFKEETALLIKEYENKISNLTEKFENKIKSFDLDQQKVSKSSELLKNNVELSLEHVTLLNERIQKVELEFSNIISIETESVKSDLNISRITLMEVIDSITSDANKKLNEINTAHSDFLTVVSNAGIYKLTENYKLKADEEKSDYKLNMWLTIGAIAFAIITTILVIAIPIIEYWKASPPVPMDYFTLFARLSISIMFFVLALYTSKQAAKHYECYQENHRTFLQLAALEPFMARMSPEEQKEIRKGLISTYFNQSTDGKFAAKGDEVDISMMFTLIDKLSNFGQVKKDPKSAESAATETKP